MMDVAAIREHIETDLSDAALARLRAAAIADQEWYLGAVDATAPDAAGQYARRNALLVDMVKLGASYNAVHVQAIGQIGADAGAYTNAWGHLLRKMRAAVVS